MKISLRRFLYNHYRIATEGSPKSGLCPTLFEMTSPGVCSRPTIDSTVNSKPLSSLGHCICTTPMTNIRPSPESRESVRFQFLLLTITDYTIISRLKSSENLDYSALLLYCKSEISSQGFRFDDVSTMKSVSPCPCLDQRCLCQAINCHLRSLCRTVVIAGGCNFGRFR